MLDKLKPHLSKITVPTMLLMSENDGGGGTDHLETLQTIYSEIKKNNSNVELKVYPPYGHDGHRLFFDIKNYWPEVSAFLSKYMQ